MSRKLDIAERDKVFRIAEGKEFKLGDKVYTPSLLYPYSYRSNDPDRGKKTVVQIDTSREGYEIHTGYYDYDRSSHVIYDPPRLINRVTYCVDPHGRPLTSLFTTEAAAWAKIARDIDAEIVAAYQEVERVQQERSEVNKKILEAQKTD
jgi:hypothetical protein